MDFQTANAAGKLGEKRVAEYLSNRGWLVEDLSDDKSFQERGIDFKISKNGVVRYIDVKTDSYTTGNMFMEMVANKQKKRAGCLLTTEADVWFYYYSRSGTVKVFSPSDMLEHIAVHGDKYRTVSCWSYINGKPAYQSEGILVPISEAPIKQHITL